LDILSELERRPINALDYGIDRLNVDFSPMLEKILREEHIFDANDTHSSNFANDQGYVLFGVFYVRHEDFSRERVVMINIGLPSMHTDGSKVASDHIFDRMKKAMSAVRQFFGAPCKPYYATGDEEVSKFCPDMLYRFFALPSDPDYGENFVRKAELERKVHLTVSAGILAGPSHRFSELECSGPLVVDEFQCKSSY